MTFSSSRHKEAGTSQLTADTRSWQKTENASRIFENKVSQGNHLLRSDTTRTYYEGTPSHNHPPHYELINGMKHRNSIKLHAKLAGDVDIATRTIAVNIREKNMTARRLSPDLRIIRRARQGKRTQKVPAAIVFDDECSPFKIYRTQGNEMVIDDSLHRWKRNARISYFNRRHV